MKNRALFVDDEPLVLSGLRRMLRSLRHDWEMSFAESGKEALALMEETGFTVIISDMRMPELDGAELLDEVAKRHPAVARLVLSGHAELDAILRAVRPAHQFLAKPCDPKLLESALKRIHHVRLDEQQRAICQKLGAHRRLPSPIVKIDELRAALDETPADLNRVGEIISGDIAMSIQVLRLVNAAFFGPPTKTFDPKRAVSILGADILKKLLDEVELFRPVVDGAEGSEEAVINLNAWVGQAALSVAAGADVDPCTRTMMSLAGSLAAIEAPEPLDCAGEWALSKLLLAFWGLNIKIDRPAFSVDHPEAVLLGA
ncbi:MAG: response regulator [Geminicoccaceae bacterium]